MKQQPLHQKVGIVGEDVACRYLISKGFRVKDRNYSKKWGEIDIITEKKGILHFVEVKTVSRENLESNVTHETNDEHRPEDNIHPEKIKRLKRVIETYILQKSVPEGKWQFDVVTVLLDLPNKVAKAALLENIIL